MSLTFYQGEADPNVTFTIKDKDGSALDVSTATLKLEVKKKSLRGTIIFEKENADFNTSQAASGIVTVPFTSSNTFQTPSEYNVELTVTFSSSDIRKYILLLEIVGEVQ